MQTECYLRILGLSDVDLLQLYKWHRIGDHGHISAGTLPRCHYLWEKKLHYNQGQLRRLYLLTQDILGFF